MVVVSYSGKEINAKLVYYGAGLSGKTTNLESIYEAVPDTSRGKMVSMKTQSDRTLFFDLLPLDLGEIMGFKTRFLLYTVPGQVFYNATRKLVLKGVDAIVFVADSEVGKMDENRESLTNLRANLSEYGLRPEEIPWVIQYNKRDLPEVYTVEELNAELNPGGTVPFFEAVATQGKGVFETFRGISHLLMDKVTRELRRAPLSTNRGPRSEEVATRSETPSIIDMMGAPAPQAKAAPPAPETPATPAAPAREGSHYGRELTLDTAQADGATEAPAAPVPAAATAKDPSSYGELNENSVPKEGEFRHSFGPQLELAPKATSPERPGVAAVQVAAVEPGVIQSTPARTHPMSVSPKAAQVAATARASQELASGASQELVVPVRVQRGTKCEIVLRIILTEDD